jgi:hypothetical protein
VKILVIRSARETVLRSYLAHAPLGARVTVLGQGPPPARCEAAPAPHGPMRWQRLDPEVRRALQARYWSEVVVLHNLGDDSYAHIYTMALRIRPTAAFRVVYADGTERRHRSVLSFFAIRSVTAAAASVALICLMGVALGLKLRRAMRVGHAALA